MKKAVKVSLLSVFGLLVVAIIVVATVINMVFSRDRLTAFVKDHASDYVTCPLEIDQVELTFFSTFPEFCFHVSNISLVNPMEGATNDTLLDVHDLYAKIDVMDYLNEERISITAFTLEHGCVNIYIDETGAQNFDVCPLLMGEPATEADTAASVLLDKIRLEGIRVDGFSASFLDRKHNLEARVTGLDASLESDAQLLELKGKANLSVQAEEIFYSDSLNFAQIADFRFDNCKLWSDGKNASLKLDQLRASSQEYLLSGDIGLMAQIIDFNLHDIDLAWQDGKPSVEVRTSLESASVTVGDEDLTYVTLGATVIDAPLESNDSLWTADVNTTIEHLNVSMDSEGVLIDDRNLDTHFKTSTNTLFNDFRVWEMQTSLGTQTVMGEMHANMADTTNIVCQLAMRLKDTSLSQILQMVPASYLTALDGMEVDMNLRNTRLDADMAMKGGNLVLNEVKVTGHIADFAYADTTNMTASVDEAGYTVIYPNSQRRPYANIVFNGSHLKVGMDDTIQVTLSEPSGKLAVDFENYGTRIKVQTQSAVQGMALAVGNLAKGTTQGVKLRLDAMYDDRKEDILEMLSPDLDVDMQLAQFDVDGVTYPIQLPRIDFSFSNNQFVVRQSELILGNSHLTLKGTLNHLADYLSDKHALEGKFALGGPKVDADQLLAMVSGMGVTEEVEPAPAAADSTAKVADPSETAGNLETSDPFMVPMGVDFELDTHVDQMVFNGNPFNNVAGQITCRDGAVVLEEVGFTSNAANMQLTALYKSPRRNNLFVGWNFHLLNIDIAEMIRLVPEIDSIAPMVKAFAGKAEFHLAGETNLFADYSPKMSTLKAVAAIEGKDLTVLDSETFQTIHKYLFKESTTNKIDSMSVELSVARKKMSLYPMLISWDKYQAVLSGTHTVVNNMPFNYHISITKCPVVGGHLGLDISGNLDDIDNISFKLGNCKYANLYRPEKRNVTQQQTLELKELINTSLKKTVK